MASTKSVTVDKVEVVTTQDEDSNDLTSVKVRTATLSVVMLLVNLICLFL